MAARILSGMTVIEFAGTTDADCWRQLAAWLDEGVGRFVESAALTVDDVDYRLVCVTGGA